MTNNRPNDGGDDETELSMSVKKNRRFIYALFAFLTASVSISIISNAKGCESMPATETPGEKGERPTWAGNDAESVRIRQELMDKYAKNNPPPMIDPFTGDVIAKATTIRVVKKAIERGEDKVANPITSYDFCGDGKLTYGVWTEIDALKRAQDDMQSVLGKNVCLRVNSSCRSNKKQYEIWRKYWVMGKDGKPELKGNGDPVTAIVVGKPGYSFHEACRAFDIDNYEQAQSYLWKQGFSGGTRGLPHDFVHFSRGGEFTNAERVSVRNFMNQVDRAKNKGKKAINKILKGIHW